MPDTPLPAKIDPTTVVTDDGETLPISLIDTDVLASWIDQLRDAKKAADFAISAISLEVVRRADQTVKTQLDGTQRYIRVTGSGRTPRWDPPQLQAKLRQLVANGVLSPEAIVGVVQRVTTWKVDTTAMKRLCKNPAVKEATDAVALPGEEPERRVTSTGWLQ